MTTGGAVRNGMTTGGAGVNAVFLLTVRLPEMFATPLMFALVKAGLAMMRSKLMLPVPSMSTVRAPPGFCENPPLIVSVPGIAGVMPGLTVPPELISWYNVKVPVPVSVPLAKANIALLFNWRTDPSSISVVAAAPVCKMTPVAAGVLGGEPLETRFVDVVMESVPSSTLKAPVFVRKNRFRVVVPTLVCQRVAPAKLLKMTV